MKLRIRSEGFRVTAALDDFLRQRLRYALGRFQDVVEHVAVRLRDDNGPRGGVDKHVQLQVRVRGRAPVLIEERGHDLYAAIGRGTQRAERQVIRSIERRRDAWRA